MYKKNIQKTSETINNQIWHIKLCYRKSIISQCVPNK